MTIDAGPSHAASVEERFALAGRRALITGGTEGIGLSAALALAQAGAEIVVHGLPAPEAEEAIRLLDLNRFRATVITGDLSTTAGVNALMQSAGPIDILISCVATQVLQDLGSVSDDAMDLQFQLNFKSSVHLLQAVLPRMREQRWGRIIMIGSVQEMKPHPRMMTYAALKAAQENLVRNIAQQVAADGITANNVAPGVILTRRSRPLLADADYSAMRLNAIPARSFGEAQDVAGLILLLSSEAGRYITGASIPVDGGMSL